MHKEMAGKSIINQSGRLESGFGIIRGRQHVLAGGCLLEAVSSRLASAHVGRGVSKDCLVVILPNMKGIVNSRVESDAVGGVNHLGEAKDVHHVTRIAETLPKAGTSASRLKVPAGASVGVHGNGLLGWATWNVANEV